MNTHIMSLNLDAFTLIKNGTKTIEMRLYDEKRQEVSKEDYIIFISTEDSNNKLKVKVKEIHKHNSFDELYKEFDKIKLGYNKEEFASPNDMDKYYSREKVKKYGVVGIEIKIDNT
jgi:ASC-1-like (ASCH) protein